MEQPEPLLSLVDVTVQYGKFVALQNVSYTIMPGQVVCLLGGNASGKSSSMKAICGTAKVTAGDIYWSGTKITDERTVARVGRGIGVVPEGRRVFASLSVIENLHMGSWSAGSRDAVQSRIDEMLNMFPVLKKLADRPAGVLSGGEQQLVAFARALMRQPKLMLMDEPSMGLSPALVTRCFEVIQQIRESGVSVFVVEQNARAALKVADYAYVLSSGRVAVEGLPAEVADAPLMREAYLGRSSEG